MAGVTNTVFRRICKAKGADVLTTEFVSAEGILHRNARTKYYLEFQEDERPLGVQLFGGDPEHLAEAARAVMEWVLRIFWISILAVRSTRSCAKTAVRPC